MAYELSALDIRYIVKELQSTLGARVDKIYHPERKELVIQAHITGGGKKIIRAVAPGAIYLSDFKAEQAERPSGFATLLRKYLENSRLIAIRQLEFERIIEFEFEGKEEHFRLIFELFSKGNIIFCKSDWTIIQPAEGQDWKDRKIRPKEPYKYPKRDLDITKLDEKGFIEGLFASKKTLVKYLASDLGLGGRYAEELCARAKIEKGIEKLDSVLGKRLAKARDVMLDESIHAATYVDDSGALKAISPIEMQSLKGSKMKLFENFNHALDEAFTTELIERSTEKKLSPHQGKIEKLQRIIASQEEYVKELEKGIDEDMKAGETIYENYQLFDGIIKELHKAREKYSLKEMKEKLKGHKIIKSLDEKEKKILVRLE